MHFFILLVPGLFALFIEHFLKSLPEVFKDEGLKGPTAAQVLLKAKRLAKEQKAESLRA